MNPNLTSFPAFPLTSSGTITFPPPSKHSTGATVANRGPKLNRRDQTGPRNATTDTKRAGLPGVDGIRGGRHYTGGETLRSTFDSEARKQLR